MSVTCPPAVTAVLAVVVVVGACWVLGRCGTTLVKLDRPKRKRRRPPLEAEPENEPSLVVGCAFMHKKVATMRATLEAPGGRLRWQPIDLSRLDAGEPLEQQGRFDVLVHKLTDDVERAQGPADGSPAARVARRRLQALDDYSRAHPAVPLVDPPGAVANVVSRAATCELLRTRVHGQPAAGMVLAAPRFVILDDPSSQRVPLLEGQGGAAFTYPLICKPVLACGGHKSHQLSIVFRPEGLRRLGPTPVVAQEFTNHNGRLFKVYVLGRAVRVFERQSLPDLPSGRDEINAQAPDGVIEFDSQRPYPTLADILGQPTTARAAKSPPADEPAPPPPHLSAAVYKAAARLRTVFGLSLFGFDTVVPAGSNQLLIIDVNYFPSYKELRNRGLPELLTEHFDHLRAVARETRGRSEH